LPNRTTGKRSFIPHDPQGEIIFTPNFCYCERFGALPLTISFIALLAHTTRSIVPRLVMEKSMTRT